ncbi:hypothetical protein TcWFU_005281 [Taenia crassiceps]|uniref:Uncharacterized protein n=1 Tax=Taenia crassiceps TaxID=6207 RepID=A0ABR4QKZ7_9CEST
MGSNLPFGSAFTESFAKSKVDTMLQPGNYGHRPEAKVQRRSLRCSRNQDELSDRLQVALWHKTVEVLAYLETISYPSMPFVVTIAITNKSTQVGQLISLFELNHPAEMVRLERGVQEETDALHTRTLWPLQRELANPEALTHSKVFDSSHQVLQAVYMDGRLNLYTLNNTEGIGQRRSLGHHESPTS